MELGPHLATLPTELILEVTSTLCSFSQKEYVNILLTCRTFYEMCRLTMLPDVPIVLNKPQTIKLFSAFLDSDERIAGRVHRLWIGQDRWNVISRCTNVASLACDGHDLIRLCSGPTFNHTRLRELTIMGLWNFWTRFSSALYSRVLCGQLERLWLLDHLFLCRVDLEWFSSLKQLSYWVLELWEDKQRFHGEIEILKILPRLDSLLVVMRDPSDRVYGDLHGLGQSRLGVYSWKGGQEVEVWQKGGLSQHCN